jgi:hypothetical protein
VERTRSVFERTASATAVFPIFGMLAGLLVGVIRARINFVDELTQLQLITRGGFVGFVLGAAIAVASVLWPGRRGATSLRGLMLAVLVAALLGWFLVTTLFNGLANGSL